VRLLHDAGTVGATSDGGARAKDNLLIRGDALNALRSLAELPEFAKEYLGRVKLAYIDPPFNTQQSFLHYDDNLEHSVWLTMMRDRLEQIQTLLAMDGSVWVHLDDAEMAYCRVMMDEIFGRENFVATVVWQKVHAPKSSARHLSSDQTTSSSTPRGRRPGNATHCLVRTGPTGNSGTRTTMSGACGDARI
jgi:adenine-specific DNA-methyltransferase